MFNFIYICYGLFYCSYFSDAEDCIILAGIPLLFKEKPENVLIWGQDQKDYPMSIKIKQRILSMDTDIFLVLVEETHIYECDNFFEAFCGLLASCNNVAPVTNLCLGRATTRSHSSQWSKKKLQLKHKNSLFTLQTFHYNYY